MDDAGDAQRADEAQQVCQEAERDAEDERSAERFPQGLPDPLWTLRGCALRLLKGKKKRRAKGGGKKLA